MSSADPEEDRDLLAAELALGVLHGADLVRARELTLSSPAFADAVGDWKQVLAAIADEAPELEPDPRVWRGISNALAGSVASIGTIVHLQKRLRAWKAISFASAAAAAAALLAVAWLPASDKPGTDASVVLVANLSSEQTGTSLSAAYDPLKKTLLVSPAFLQGAGGHNHELWIIPEGGDPEAVGLILPGRNQRLSVRAEIAPLFDASSSLAVSVEPVGGSPTGKPTGPVIASGKFSSI